MSRSGLILVGAMLAAGLVLGLLELRRPGWSEPVPALGILLLVMLTLDIVLQQLAARGRVEPLTTPVRGIAFIGGGILLVGLPWLLR